MGTFDPFSGFQAISPCWKYAPQGWTHVRTNSGIYRLIFQKFPEEKSKMYIKKILMKTHFPPLPLTSIHCSAWVSGHHAWGHVVALASMFPLWDPDGQRDRLTMWLPPPPPFPPPPYRLSLSVTVWEASWFLTVVQTGWVGSLISSVIFIGGLQPLLQILKLSLFHLRPDGIHLSVVLRLLTCHTCSTRRVCQCVCFWMCITSITVSYMGRDIDKLKKQLFFRQRGMF